ncbi:hypothetical protein N7451_003260 [Penicillium sp. IBT 35674x]|nr:hypothetical protein N7451_003260 [Penicillium sp. IBT 35674x]
MTSPSITIRYTNGRYIAALASRLQTYALHSPDGNGEEFKCSQPDCDYTVAEWWEFVAHHRTIHGYTKRDIYGMFPYHPDTAAEMKATIGEKGRRMANELVTRPSWKILMFKTKRLGQGKLKLIFNLMERSKGD